MTPAQTPQLQEGESLGAPLSQPLLNEGESLGAPVSPTMTGTTGSISGRSGAPNVMASDESDADIQARLNKSPIVHGIGEGLESLSSPILHPIDTAVNLVKQSVPGIQMVDSFKKAVPMFRVFHDALSQGKSLHDAIAAANDYAGRQEASTNGLEQAIADYKKNPSTQTANNLKQAAARVTTLAVGTAGMIAAGGVGATAEEAPEVAATQAANTERQAANATHVFNETTGVAEPITQPGILKQAWQGEKVAQPGAQAAVRSGVQAGSETAGTADETLAANLKNQPLVKGHNTFMDDHLSALEDQERAAYKKMDDTAGFDVKALKEKLATDQYNLKQLGSSDPDKAGRLIEAINDSTDRIADAEAKMKAADVNPKTADAIHMQRMAGEDFKKSLIKNTNPADGSVNIDGLLNDAKKLRFSKYGDRLQQFMSKDGADNYVSQLEEMQRLGAHAVKAQKIALWVGKYVVPEAVGGALATGYALSK